MSKITVRDVVKSICILQSQGNIEDACFLYEEIIDDGLVDIEEWPDSSNHLLLKQFFVGLNQEEIFYYEDDEIRDILKSCKKELKNFSIDGLIDNPNTKQLAMDKEKFGEEISRLFQEAREFSNPPFLISDEDARPLDLDDSDNDII